MSGGELQRVLTARAIAGETELLLLDEPTTAVDFHAEQELIDLLLSPKASGGQRDVLVRASHASKPPER